MIFPLNKQDSGKQVYRYFLNSNDRNIKVVIKRLYFKKTSVR